MSSIYLVMWRCTTSCDLIRSGKNILRYPTMLGIAASFFYITKTPNTSRNDPWWLRRRATSHDYSRFTPDGPRSPKFTHRKSSYGVEATHPRGDSHPGSSDHKSLSTHMSPRSEHINKVDVISSSSKTWTVATVTKTMCVPVYSSSRRNNATVAWPALPEAIFRDLWNNQITRLWDISGIFVSNRGSQEHLSCLYIACNRISNGV